MSTLVELAQQVPPRFVSRLTEEQQTAAVLLNAKRYRLADIVKWFGANGVKTSAGSVSKVLRHAAAEAERVKAATAAAMTAATAPPADEVDLMQALKESLQPPRPPNVTGTPDAELGI